MPKEIQLKKAHRDVFVDQDSSWMALDLPEIKPPLYSKAFILFLSGFFVTAVLYSAFTEVPVVVESQGKLAMARPAVPIRAVSTFTVDSLRVKENQIVKAGEILVTSGQGLKASELALLRELGQSLNAINSQQPLSQCNNCLPQVQKVMALSAKLSRNQVVRQILQPVGENCRALAVNLLQMKSLDQKMDPLRTRIAQFPRNGTRAPASVGSASGKEAQMLQVRLQKSRTLLLNSTKAVASSLEELMAHSGVKAPFEGKIVNIRLKGPGELVGGGQSVMEIVPLDNRMVANLEVLNKDIGSIHVGDAVEVAVDAYPEIDYGVLKGHISEILPSDLSDQPANSYYGQEKGFRVRVSLDTQEFRTGDSNVSLLPGMSVRARTMRKQETLLKTFYRSIFRIRDDIRVHS